MPYNVGLNVFFVPLDGGNSLRQILINQVHVIF